MGLFDIIKQKREAKVLDKSKQIEEQNPARKEERLKQEQTTQQQFEGRKKDLQSLLNLPIEQDYIVKLHRYIRDGYDHILYGEYDYFLCVERTDFGYGDEIEVIKITGKNLGDRYIMNGHGHSVSSIELWDRNGKYWEGRQGQCHIPDHCRTIRHLNNYATAKNKQRKQEYEEKSQKTIQAGEMFFK